MLQEYLLPPAIKRIERPELDCLVAIDLNSNQVLRFADFGPCREKPFGADAELYAICLHTSSQKKGIGKALFTNGYQAAKKRSYKKMMVSVFERNANARSFYEKMSGQMFSITEIELGDKTYPTANYIWTF